MPKYIKKHNLSLRRNCNPQEQNIAEGQIHQHWENITLNSSLDDFEPMQNLPQNVLPGPSGSKRLTAPTSRPSSRMLQTSQKRANTAGSSGVVVMDVPFSEMPPVQNELEEALPGPSGYQNRLVTSYPIHFQNEPCANTTVGSNLVVWDGSFSDLLPMKNNTEEVLPAPSAGPFSSTSSRMVCNEVNEQEVEDELQLSQIPDFTTAVTSTPRRDLDEEGPMLINLGVMRHTIRIEKEQQQQQAREWLADIRNCLQSKTRPYSNRLRYRKAVLKEQIDKIRKQKEALDQLLNSLETENRDVEKQIEYLETFSKDFPTFPF